MKPKVVLVGGLDWNVPDELRECVEIVKHVEQTNSFRVGTMPAADYIFVISDFASHNLVESVSKQLSIPIVWLKKGWSHMKLELERRSILPPDLGRTARVTEATTARALAGVSCSQNERLELKNSFAVLARRLAKLA